MKDQLFIVITFLFMVLGEPLLAVSYTPYTPAITPTYTSSYSSTSYPSMASVRRMAATTTDYDYTEPGNPSDPGTGTIELDYDEPGNPADPNDGTITPIGSPWPLLLFAAAYAAYGALRLRRRSLSTNEKTR